MIKQVGFLFLLIFPVYSSAQVLSTEQLNIIRIAYMNGYYGAIKTLATKSNKELHTILHKPQLAEEKGIIQSRKYIQEVIKLNE